MNDPRRLTQQQAYDLFRSIDTNFDGRIDKLEIFNACKFMFSTQPYMGSYNSYQPASYNYQYMGTPQPQVIIITKSSNQPNMYNPYNANPYR